MFPMKCHARFEFIMHSFIPVRRSYDQEHLDMLLYYFMLVACLMSTSVCVHMYCSGNSKHIILFANLSVLPRHVFEATNVTLKQMASNIRL